MCNWGPGAKMSEQEDTDDDADEANWYSEQCPDKFYMFNWRRIESDPRFMYERAS
jgi:hypothetical protein